MADQILVEPGASVFTGGEVRVAILPVGDIPRHVLDTYVACINQSRHIALSNMRARCRETNQKTPFGNLDWEHGFMHFRFMNLDEARKKSLTSDLHRQRQIVAVLGIVHCPWMPSLRAAHTEFVKMSSLLFPEAPLQRCLLVNPSEEHFQQIQENEFDSFVTFEPGGDLGHLEQQFSLWIHDLAAQVLAELEQWVLNASPLGMPMGPACYADSPEYTRSHGVQEDSRDRRMLLTEEEAHEKKRWGRLMKAKGDMCLMAGSCQDAFDHYRTCSDLARVSSDLVWYGGAVEGMATARVLQALNRAEPSPSMTRSSSQPGQLETWMAEPSSSGMDAFAHPEVAEALRVAGVESEVRSLLHEARAAYKKKGGVPAASIEVALKLARLTTSLRGGGGKDAQQEVTDMVAAVLEAIPGLVASVEDRMVALEEAAMVLRTVGPTRKRSLLLWYACELAAKVSGPRGGGGLAVRKDTLRLAARALTPPHKLSDVNLNGWGIPMGSSSSAAAANAAAAAAAASSSGDDASSSCKDTKENGEGGEGAQQQQQQQQQQQPRAKAPHWAQRGAWHTGMPPWGSSWSCLPPSMRMQYLSTVAPMLLGGVSAAKQPSSAPPSMPVSRKGSTSAPHSRTPSTWVDPAQPAISATRTNSGASNCSVSDNPLFEAAQGGASTGAARGPPVIPPASGPALRTSSSSSSIAGAGLASQAYQQAMRGPKANNLASSPSRASQLSQQQQLSQQLSHLRIPEASLGSLACGPPLWPSLRLGLLEAALHAAQQTNNTADVWEVCSAMLRDHSHSLSPAQQNSLLEAACQAASSLTTSGTELAHALASGGGEAAQAWHDEGPARCGPGPISVLSRIVPAPLGLQPLCFSITAVAGTGRGGSSGSPFIFNPTTAKKAEGQAMAAAAVAAKLWCAGEDGGVEVCIANPLSVPLRLESIALHALLIPDRPPPPTAAHSRSSSSSALQAPPAAPTPVAAPTPSPSPARSSSSTTLASSAPSPSLSTAASSSLAPPSSAPVPPPPPNWEPYGIGPLLLPPGGQPIRLLLQGRAHVPGRLVFQGVHVSLWGVTWLQPFVQAPAANALQSTMRTLNTKKGKSKGGPDTEEAVTVVPPLPVLNGVLNGPQGLKVLAPPKGGLHGSAAATSHHHMTPRLKPKAHTFGPRIALMDVWEGQSALCEITLINASPAPSFLSIACARLVVTNTKGVPQKSVPFTNAAQSALTGVSLDVDDAALQAAMPLAPNASVTLPASVRVGRVPAGTTEHKMTLEVSVLYTNTSPQDQPPQQALSYSAQIPPGHLLGRRLVLPLSFHVHSALHITSTSFLQQYTPTRDGLRCRQLPLPLQAPSSPAPHAHTPPHANHAHPHRQSSLTRNSSGQVVVPSGVLSPLSKKEMTPATMIAHQLQAALEPLTAPGEKLRAALGIGSITTSSLAKKLQAPQQTPLLGSSQERAATTRSFTASPTPGSPSQHEPHTAHTHAHAHAGGEAWRHSHDGTQRTQGHAGVSQQQLEARARCVCVDELCGGDGVGDVVDGFSTGSSNVQRGHSVRDARALSAGHATDAAHANDANAAAVPAVHMAHAEHAVCAAHDEVLLGLAADAVLCVGVANRSADCCFQVWLVPQNGATSTTTNNTNSSSTTDTTNNNSSSNEVAGAAIEAGAAGPSNPDAHAVDSSSSSSPPVVLKPGQSAQLLAYLDPHSPGTVSLPPQLLTPTTARTGLSTHTLLPDQNGPGAAGAITQASCKSNGSSEGASGSANAATAAIGGALVDGLKGWQPSGGEARTAARTAAGGWVVAWRLVPDQDVPDGATQHAHQDAAGLSWQRRPPAPLPPAPPAAAAAAAAAAARVLGSVDDAPQGVAWLDAAVLEKSMTTQASAALDPPLLHFSTHTVSFPHHPCMGTPAADGRCSNPCCGAHPRLREVSSIARKLGGLALHSGLGPLWAATTEIGQVLELRVTASSSSLLPPPPPPPPPSAAAAAAGAAAGAGAAHQKGVAEGSRAPAQQPGGSNEHEWSASICAQGGGCDGAGQHASDSHIVCAPPLHVRYSVRIQRVAPPPSSSPLPPSAAAAAVSSEQHQGSSSSNNGSSSNDRSSCNGAFSAHIDQGVMVVSGATQNVHAGLLSGQVHSQTLLLAFHKPGLYQVHITDTAAAPLASALAASTPTQPPTSSAHSHSEQHLASPTHHLDNTHPQLPGNPRAINVINGGVSSSANGGATERFPSQPVVNGRHTGADGAALGGGWALAAAEVLRGSSALGHAALLPTPARVDVLNVLAVAPGGGPRQQG